MSRKTRKTGQTSRWELFSSSSSSSDPSGNGGSRFSGRAWGRPAVYLVIIVLIAGAVGLALHAMEGRVLTGRAGLGPVKTRITLAHQPAWMPDALADRIAASCLPAGANYYDKELAGKVHHLAAVNPWIHEVIRVEKCPEGRADAAVVQLDATFRVPVGRVPAEAGFAYVDAEGVRLPAEQVPKWAVLQPAAQGKPAVTRYYLIRNDVPTDCSRDVRRIHYIVIEGARSPAPSVGGHWQGDDLAAGLRLIRLVSSRPYANQITVVDVRNYAGRVSSSEPHLRMYAQLHRSQPTDIRFGRFPMPGGDYVVSPERKMSYLDEYVADHNGRLAGLCRYIDLRYDQLHISIN